MKVSIITVTYNNADTIADTIRSVQKQTYPDIEYIVIDGKSIDGTQQILSSYFQVIDILVSEADKGMYFAMNKGINLATGELIAFLHADDLYADNQVIEWIVTEFNNHQTDTVYGDLVYVKRKKPDKIFRNWKSGQFSLQKLKRGWMPPHPSFFIKKKIYLKYGFYDTSFKIAADYELIIRLLGRHNVSTHYLPNVLVKMRTGGKSNKNIAGLIKKSIEDYKALKKNRLGNMFTVLIKIARKIPQIFIFSILQRKA